MRVFKPAADYVDNGVRIAGRYLTFSVMERSYVVDTRVRRYMLLGGDGVAIDRRALIVSSWTKRKVLHPKNRIVFVPIRALPHLSRCAR